MRKIVLTHDQFKRQLAWTRNKAIFKFVREISKKKKFVDSKKDYMISEGVIKKIAKRMFK